VNGTPINNFSLEKLSVLNLAYLFTGGKIDINRLQKSLLFSKSENWSLEDETRIIFDLRLSDITKGSIIKPEINDTKLKTVSKFFQPCAEICLKKIPFDAFKSLTLGYSIDTLVQEKIIYKAKSNSELKHLTFKKVQHNIYGKLETVEIET